MARQTDLDLLVDHAVTTVNVYGYGSYREENRLKAAQFQGRLEVLQAEAARRGLMTPDGQLTPAGAALRHTTDPRVVAKEEDNRAYFRARFAHGAAHVSPYGESYGRSRSA